MKIRPAQEHRYTTVVILKRLLFQARGYWLHLGGLLILSFLATPLMLLNPLPLKIIVDSVIGSEPLPRYLTILFPGGAGSPNTSILLTAIVLLVIFAILTQLRNLSERYLQAHTTQKLVLAFRARLFRHAQRLSLAYHDRVGTIDATYRIQFDASAVQQVLMGGVLPIIRAFSPLAGVIVVTSLIDYQLTFVALSTAPVMLLLVRYFGWRLREKWKSVKSLDSSSMSVVQESLSTLRVVKAFGRENHEEERFVEESSLRVEGHLNAVLTSSTYNLLVGLTVTSATAIVLYVGTLHVRSGVLTLGELLMVMTYIGQIFGPLRSVSNSAVGLSNGLAGGERALRLLDEAPDIQDIPNARAIGRARGAVAFENVSFSYVEAQPVLKDASFVVEPGMCAGMQGRTGAGKSTLMSLLMRFYDPDSGRILVDGVDTREYRLEDFRKQFGIVLQEPVLFSTTIAENIEYGRPGASRKEIVETARLANAHDFITALKNGYDTQVGERGMMLSGGERQRLALARAFLRDAPILILDEPTSSVDQATESGIMEALERLQKDRTTFLISHRVSTLSGCDLVLTLESGKLRAVAGTRKEIEGASAGGMSKTSLIRP